MFRMLGKKVELVRFQIGYISDYDEREVIEDCVSDEDRRHMEQLITARNISFTTTPIDQIMNEWFEGLEFDSYDEAASVFNAGELAFNKTINDKKAESPAQLRADMDYIAIMTGVDL